jgi:hypothetical protein
VEPTKLRQKFNNLIIIIITINIKIADEIEIKGLMAFNYLGSTEYNEPTNAHLYNKTLI